LENSVGIFKPKASADRVLTVQFNPAMLLVQLITPKKVLAEDERETTMLLVQLKSLAEDEVNGEGWTNWHRIFKPVSAYWTGE